MRYLLDTHTFLWFISDDKQLSENAKSVLNDLNLVKYLSIASFWEIAIKIKVGKLKLDSQFMDLENEMNKNGFELLPITFVHTAELCTLELHHRDPFDRMIIAQAITEKLILISKDNNFTLYDKLDLLW